METTHSIWGVEDNEVLKPMNLNNTNIINSILFESSSDDEDGTYPLVMHYTNLINKIDSEGTNAWLNRLVSTSRRIDFLNIDYGICEIIRESKYANDAIIKFKNPIKIQIELIGETPVIIEVSEISGQFIHEYYWTRKGRQNKVANGFEIWFNIKKYLK